MPIACARSPLTVSLLDLVMKRFLCLTFINILMQYHELMEDEMLRPIMSLFIQNSLRKRRKRRYMFGNKLIFEVNVVFVLEAREVRENHSNHLSMLHEISNFKTICAQSSEKYNVSRIQRDFSRLHFVPNLMSMF